MPPSTGRASWRGLKEKADLAAVCRFALTQLEEPPGRLVLIGYSHGGILTSAVAGEMPEVRKEEVCGVALPAMAFDWIPIHRSTFHSLGAGLCRHSLSILRRLGADLLPSGRLPRGCVAGKQAQALSHGTLRNSIPVPTVLVHEFPCSHPSPPLAASFLLLRRFFCFFFPPLN